MSAVIRTRLVKIGNSQGIRIPKVVLEQLNLTDTIELEVQYPCVLLSCETDSLAKIRSEPGREEILWTRPPHLPTARP